MHKMTERKGNRKKGQKKEKEVGARATRALLHGLERGMDWSEEERLAAEQDPRLYQLRLVHLILYVFLDLLQYRITDRVGYPCAT
jgi:hypothetical protein